MIKLCCFVQDEIQRECVVEMVALPSQTSSMDMTDSKPIETANVQGETDGEKTNSEKRKVPDRFL